MLWKQLALGALFASPAWAQSSDEPGPWDTEEPPAEESEETEEPEAPPDATPDNAANSETAPPATAPAPPEPPAPANTEDEPDPKGKKDRKRTREPVQYGENFRPGGLRIAAYGTETGVGIGMKTVVGRTGGPESANGGTGVGPMSGTVLAGYSAEKWGVVVGLPFTQHRVPGLRFDNSLAHSTGLGNLNLDGYFVLADGKIHSVLAVETHFNLGNRAYTWINDGDELWPGYGVDLAWQGTSGDKLKKLYRFAMGVHFAQGHNPFPSFFPRFSAAFGLDYSFSKRVGWTNEAVLTYWDTSPFDVNTLLRVDVLDGLRARAGVTLPIATWAGLIPADQEPGLSEATFIIDMRYAF